MEEKTAFDVLFDNLTARGLQPEKEISERTFVVPGKDRLSSTKYIIAGAQSCFFCAYDSHGTSAYSSKTFTGIYAAILLPSEIECHIYKKDWIDLVLRTHKRTSGIKFIDENLTITSATDWTPSQLLTSRDVALFLDINARIEPLKITIQHDYLPIIEALKNKTVIGLETDSWLYEEKDLETLLTMGGQFIENMTKACALAGQ